MTIDFIIIGAQKCATTLLANQLGAHPEVSFCTPKEPHFFSKESDWAGNLEAYHSLYRKAKGCIYGEASTTYTFFPLYPHVPSVLRQYNPNLKLIYLVRDPIERMISSYMHAYAMSRVRLPIDRALLDIPFFLNVSRYAVQLRWYLERFPREQLLVLPFRDVVVNSESAWQKITRFLGISPPRPTDLNLGRKNAATEFRWVRHFPGKNALARTIKRVPGLRRLKPPPFLLHRWEARPELLPETEWVLWRLLEDDVRFLEEYLGERMLSWRERYGERSAPPGPGSANERP